MLRKPPLLAVTTLLSWRNVVTCPLLVALKGAERASPARSTTIRREESPGGCTA